MNLAGSVDENDAGAGIGVAAGLDSDDAAEVTDVDLLEEPTGTFSRLCLAGLM